MDRPLLPSEATMPVPELVRPSSRPRAGSLGRAAALTALAVWEALTVLWAALAVTLVVVGLGVLLVPGAFDAIRSNAVRERRLARLWSGVRVSESYAAAPAEGRTGLGAAWRRTYAMLGDRATWKDVLFHLTNPVVGGLLACLPLLAIVHGVWGVVLVWLWDEVTSAGGTSWFLFVPLTGQGPAVVAGVLGVIEIVVGVLLAGPLVQAHARWVRTALSTESRAGLEDRVEHLAQSRSDVVHHEASELRRIERDLHDGAQARLVAMGMTLTAAERLVEDDPAAARAMLHEVRATSQAALTELRELVRGIHPPVLADRGLVDAIRARALESPLEVEVRSSLDGRPLPPFESAVYFAVSELMTNVGKHAEAERVQIGVSYDEGMLRVSVRDDGIGGADPEKGTGLRGVERRLAAFDGFLLVHSPDGGPTTVSVVVPCDLHQEL